MQDINKILLITDLDGTLLPESKVISQTDLKAINDFKQRGGLFTVATGRNIQASEKYLNQLEPNVPVILYNGALIYNSADKEILYSNCLDEKSVNTVRDILEKFDFIGCEILKSDGIYVVKNSKEEQEHIEICKVNPVFCSIDDMKCENWLKVLFAVPPDKSDELWEYVSSLENSSDFVRSANVYIELLPHNVSKGNALKKLKEIIPENTKIIAVGDYNNDVEMLEFADIGIAPSNACEEVKKSADFISEKSCEENALADAVEYIFTEVI